MNLTGVFINAICVFAAGILGSIFKKGIAPYEVQPGDDLSFLL